MSHKMLDTVRA